MADATGSNRKPIMIVIMIVVLAIIAWQVRGLMGTSTPPPPIKTAAKAPGTPGAPVISSTPQPQAAQLVQDQSKMTANEIALMKQQQETQARYVDALSQLQMLKVAKDIAEANQAIMSARLAAVVSQKKIVDTLSMPSQGQGYSMGPSGGPVIVAPSSVPKATAPSESTYNVISVSQLQGRWSAVMGVQGQNSLISVRVGDVLPADGSKVVGIDKNGVTLEREGSSRRVSMVSVI